ncbi:MAG TPA: hypothetical protein DDW84_00045 [Phycisphaerales bacterium]|nr:MAG: hypothetical protein A2Y13_03135 [Planctomycetes bacterium GWC2_45_44]HBG77227.1 hypothetical protein [Phycisphaerales bacterium]HBR19222.1 hypothetical protein [Phycisphaerales bacterium]
MKKALIVISVLLSVVVMSGCLEQFWPAEQVSPTTVKYAGKDPNDFKLPITTLGNVEKIKLAVEETYLERQIRLKSEIDIDGGKHSIAKNELDVNIQQAKEQYETVIGSLDSPGVLWTVLTALLSGGAMRWITTLTHYSEEEYRAGVAKAAGEKS